MNLDPRPLARRARELTQAQLAAMPTTARDLWLRTLDRLRVVLDLPSRAELADLTARLEALDARIAAMAGERTLERAPDSLLGDAPTADAAAATAATADTAPVQAAAGPAAAADAP